MLSKTWRSYSGKWAHLWRTWPNLASSRRLIGERKALWRRLRSRLSGPRRIANYFCSTWAYEGHLWRGSGLSDESQSRASIGTRLLTVVLIRQDGTGRQVLSPHGLRCLGAPLH